MFDMIPDPAAKRAELTPDTLAFRDRGTGLDWTFGKINSSADAVAHGLTNMGLNDGDRIGVLCHNRAEFFVLLLACLKSNLILCPLNWRQPAPELVDTLSPIEPRIILHDNAHQDLARTVCRDLNAEPVSIERTLTGWITNGGPALSAPVPATRPWYLLFTSGTTGRPKAVIQTPRMCWANAVNIGQAIGLGPTDKSVNYLPLFHTAGINLYTLPVFLNGGTSTILPRFEPETLLQLISVGEVTQFFGVPAIYQAFSLMENVREVDWTKVRCGCGGAPLSEPLIHFFSDLGVKVLNGFGMTETGPTTFLMDPDNAARKIGSVGRAQMLTDVRLAGVPGQAPGEGEIQLRGPNITPGYFENPEATAATFTEDGWLKTGDIGRRDAEGYMFVVDRIKDMFISGGENVYPAEVERVLHEHEDVLEAAVIGVAHEKWGEVGAAFVLARPGHNPDPEALRQWCRDRIAAYKVPVTVALVQTFPRTAAGKIRKPDLRKALP